MKKTYTAFIVLFSLMVIFLSSCNVNKFSSRKNFHPRVALEAINTVPDIETVNIENSIPVKKDSVKLNVLSKSNTNNVPQIKPKETIVEKVVNAFFPKKKEIFAPVIHPQKHQLNKVKHTTLDGDEITGLVISLLAFFLAAASVFMVIGMAHVNLYAFFLVGLILAAVAIAIAFIAKKVLPFRGISLAAGVLGILSVILILVFLVLILVGVVF